MSETRNPEWNPITIIGWLMREGRLMADGQAMIAALGEQLMAEGAPICRLRVSMRTLHPLVLAVSATWERDGGLKPVNVALHGFHQNTSFAGSPIEIITTTKEPYRRRLEGALGPDDPSMLHDLKARGITDYFGRLLNFSEGRPAVFIVSSDTPGGFSDADLEKIHMIAGAISPILEVFNTRQIARALADAYLGPRTGQRVLSGQITRGDIETIDAAILISDLRGWTRMNQELPPEETVALANGYFEQMAAAIDAHGGEILKFLGDGVLAIFPGAAEVACVQALAAAQLAQRSADGVSFGIGLHVGSVLYGNVGSAERIDFTVMGPAVNLVARIEGLCAELGESVLYSAAFARALPENSRKVAQRMLKGLAEPVDVYAAPT